MASFLYGAEWYIRQKSTYSFKVFIFLFFFTILNSKSNILCWVFYCKHIQKWYSSKNPHGFIDCRVVSIHLKSLLFWLLVAEVISVFWQHIAIDWRWKHHKKKCNTKNNNCKPSNSLNTILVLFRWTNKTQYLTN